MYVYRLIIYNLWFNIIVTIDYLLNYNIVCLSHRKKLTLVCPKCGEDISLDECFKDRAAENELQTATIKCINQDCPWEGPGKLYKVLLMAA